MTEYQRVDITGALSSIVDPCLRPDGGSEVVKLTLWIKGRDEESFGENLPRDVTVSHQWPDAQEVIDALVGPLDVSSRPDRSVPLREWEQECRTAMLDRFAELDLGTIVWLGLDPQDPTLVRREVEVFVKGDSDLYFDAIDADGDYVIDDFMLRLDARWAPESLHRLVGRDTKGAGWKVVVKPRPRWVPID